MGWTKSLSARWWTVAILVAVSAWGSRAARGAIYLDEDQTISLRSRIYSQAADSHRETLGVGHRRRAPYAGQLVQNRNYFNPELDAKLTSYTDLDEGQLAWTSSPPTISAPAWRHGASTTASTITAAASSRGRQSQSTRRTPTSARSRTSAYLPRRAELQYPERHLHQRTLPGHPCTEPARHLRLATPHQRGLSELQQGPALRPHRQAGHLVGRIGHHRHARSEQPVRRHPRPRPAFSRTSTRRASRCGRCAPATICSTPGGRCRAPSSKRTGCPGNIDINTGIPADPDRQPVFAARSHPAGLLSTKICVCAWVTAGEYHEPPRCAAGPHAAAELRQQPLRLSRPDHRQSHVHA